jgi:Zn-dependent protease with chaperone function
MSGAPSEPPASPAAGAEASVALRLFDGASARARAGRLHRLSDGQLELALEGETPRVLDPRALALEPPLPGLALELRLDDGGRLRIEDRAGFEALVQGLPLRREFGQRLQRIEGRRRALALALGIAAAALALLYWRGIPLAAGLVAERLPEGSLEVASDQALTLLERLAFEPTQLSSEQQQALEARFAALLPGLPQGPRYRLLLRDAPGLGPNALALPDGRVVVTDALVELLEDDELDAVLLHEFGHVVERHGAQLVLRATAIGMVLALVAGDLSGLGSIGAGLPPLLLQQGYSRGFEAGADRFAAESLRRRGSDSAPLRRALEKLGRAVGKEAAGDGGPGALLASHPSIRRRIADLERFDQGPP